MARGGFGGGGRGFGGGGRSFGGGGGSRSFGGGLGGSSRSGGRSGGSHRSGGFGGSSHSGWGGGRSGGGSSPLLWYLLGRGSGGGGGNNRSNNSGDNGGCLKVVLIFSLVLLFIVVVATLIALFAGGSGSGGEITASTVERQALPAGAVQETDYYHDGLNWIHSPNTLLTGMKSFYQQTGVQPFLYLTSAINGQSAPDNDTVESFAYQLYDELFSDEAHLLVIFLESNDRYYSWYLAGVQAQTVIDAEAGGILLDSIDYYYYQSDLTDEEFFSQAFARAGEEMMQVYVSPWPKVWISLAVVAALIIGFIWWKRAKERRAREAAETERILNTPLESFGDQEIDQLEKKYQDTTDADPKF